MTEIPAEDWEGCSAAELASYWRLPLVRVFERVGSTNDVARGLAHEGAPHGTLVIAEEQVTGRGRGRHTWSSPAGVGLWVSLLLRDLPPAGIGLLPIRIALAVADGLDPWARGAVRVKWPNDLLLNGRKLGGILCEASWDGHKLDHVVVGIGLNLVQGPDDFPDPIRDAAISLRIFANAPLSRYDVASSVVARLRDLAFTPWAAAESVVEDFAARDALYGRPIEVRDPEALQLLQSGVADGIDAGGALLLRRDDGANGAVRTGTVRLRER